MICVTCQEPLVNFAFRIKNTDIVFCVKNRDCLPSNEVIKQYIQHEDVATMDVDLITITSND
jgi:hypothetical protein